MLIALQGAVSQGVLWGIMVLGVFITFRLLDIPDMTCDGSFALGGCVCAVLIDSDLERQLLQVLRMKPRRTASGVATITVITKPWPCSGDCLFCPNVFGGPLVI